MKTYRYYTVDVFADERFQGNPLSVVPDARGLDGERMQLLAREFNYSESAFVLPREDDASSFQVRIFTPAEELPFAGHPTLGTAFVLLMTGAFGLEDDRAQITLLEGAGSVPVTVDATHGRPLRVELTAPQPYSQYSVDLGSEDLAEVLALDPEDLIGEDEPAVAIGCGLPFLLVPLRDLAAVKRAALRLDIWERRSNGRAPSMVYLMTRETERGADLHVRLFAPGVGVSEDPATGSAATALAGYLGQRTSPASGSWHWTIEQGIEIGRPSRLEISAEKTDDRLTALRCAGACVRIFEGTFDL